MTAWRRRTKGDPAVVALADRHYSRLAYGRAGTQVGPPGRLLVFMTADERALWVSHWPQARMALDRLDAWRCVLFRNEGPTLSSVLVRAAMAATTAEWGAGPADGWLTWVDTAHVRSSNPGFCFQMAGWWVDWSWASRGKRSRTLVRLRCAA